MDVTMCTSVDSHNSLRSDICPLQASKHAQARKCHGLYVPGGALKVNPLYKYHLLCNAKYGRQARLGRPMNVVSFFTEWNESFSSAALLLSEGGCPILRPMHDVV
jgi:hypothetical protein